MCRDDNAASIKKSNDQGHEANLSSAIDSLEHGADMLRAAGHTGLAKTVEGVLKAARKIRG